MMRRILHITPHLGGGVGRVLSQVARYHHEQHTGIEERFVCLEAPEKTQFAQGLQMTVAPDMTAMRELLGWADIVQLEWWQHPLALHWLHATQEVPCRRVIWAHSSGLHYPQFPKGLAALPHAFMVTAAASLGGLAGNVRLVPSSGGFGDAPPARKARQPLRFGYLGSLNAAKLHPAVIDYLDAVGDMDFQVRFYGDREPGMPVRESTRAQLMGYTDNPAAALAEMDVFVYLLNPQHYGTTENALLEAMHAGAVPIVLNHPVETGIVRHGETGLVVDSPAAFAEAVAFLSANPLRWEELSRAAMDDVRSRFGLERTVAGLMDVYDEVMEMPEQSVDAKAVIGDTPLAWLHAGLGEHAALLREGHGQERRRQAFLYERSKSSPFHFLRYFPQDAGLKAITGMLERDCAEQI